MVGVSSDTLECQKRFAETYKLPFHLIRQVGIFTRSIFLTVAGSDDDGAVRASYQVPNFMGGLMPGRVTFIIAPHSRRIMKIHSSNLSAEDHIYTSLRIVAEILELESRMGSMALVDLDALETSLTD